jgi:hypothetical protein
MMLKSPLIKMIKDHCHEANSCISLMRKYLLEEIQGQSDKTYAAFWLERQKREDALLSIWEGIAKDIANTFCANNELSANLASIKQLVDTNAATSTEALQKNQSIFDKITANQSIFQSNLREILTSMATTTGTLATIATMVSFITQTTTMDLVKAAVMGVKTMMVKEIGNIADMIARVEGDMAVLWNLVTLVQPPQVDATTVPTGTGPAACSNDKRDTPGPPLGPPPLSLQDRVDILDGADGRPLAAT